MPQQAGQRTGDPFADADFMDRAAKLLALLSTDNEAEADAAWRKLRSHLAARGLVFTDLANRLRGAPRDASGGRQWRAADLERELAMLRMEQFERESALRRARADAQAAARQAAALEAEAEELRRETAMARTMSRGFALVAIALAVISGGMAARSLIARAVPPAPPLQSAGTPDTRPLALPPPAMPSPPTPASPPGTVRPQFLGGSSASPDRPLFSWQRGGAPGTRATPPPRGEAEARRGAIVADSTMLLATASATAPVRGILARGTPVLILRNLDRDGMLWSLVRTDAGEGYVAAADVAPAR